MDFGPRVREHLVGGGAGRMAEEKAVTSASDPGASATTSASATTAAGLVSAREMRAVGVGVMGEPYSRRAPDGAVGPLDFPLPAPTALR
jgi:hypothetical protein